MREYDKEFDNEMDDEDYCDSFSLCDYCNKERPNEDLVECPSSWDEVKHGITRNRIFCSDCCQDIFEWEGCQMDIGNCDRATEIMEGKLKEYAENNDLKPFQMIDKTYTDEFKTFAIGTWNTSFTKVKGQIIDKMVENFDIFDGEDSIIIEKDNQRICYNKDIVEEIYRIFEALGCNKDRFFLLEKRKFLVVNGIGMHGIVPPLRENKIPYNIERARFVEKILHGQNFFKLSKEDGAIVVDYKKMHFDWNKLDDQKFQELCYDIFQSMDEIEDVRLTAGTADLGQDIRAEENVNTLTGQKKRIWTIECKYFNTRKVLPSDIADMPNAYAQLKFNVFCLMTSNFLSPGTFRMLEAWKNEPTSHFTTKIWARALFLTVRIMFRSKIWT
jgi:hypothetical protein